MKREQRTKEYLEFVEEFRSRLSLLTMDGEAKISFRTESSGGKKEDLLIAELSGTDEGVHIQRFHIKDIYKSYKESGDMEGILSEAEQCLNYCRIIGRNNPLEFQENYEAIKSRLIVRAINYKNNAESLEKGVYKLIGDIALALYIEIGDYEGLYSSSPLSEAVMMSWGKSHEEAFEEAMKNTCRLYTPRLFNLKDISSFRDPDYGLFLDREAPAGIRSEDCLLFVTTRFYLNGAVSIFLPGVARRLGEIFESDLYFAFTSINEAAVHSCDAITLTAVQEGLDRLDSDPEEDDLYLSHRIYHYSREKDELTAL